MSILSLIDGIERELGVPQLPEPQSLALHVLYGGAHLFTGAESIAKLGARARAAMDAYGADDATFAHVVTGQSATPFASELAARVRGKLASRPVEAICVDFEDGYGLRADAEEDAEADRVGDALNGLFATAPTDAPTVGIRVKAITPPTTRRSLTTLERVLTRATRGGVTLPADFTVTLPKISSPAEVHALVRALEQLERELSLPRPIGVELMVETPQALFDEAGAVALPRLAQAAGGRLSAMHLGAYDLTASAGVTAADQRLDHPLCDLARMLLVLTVGARASVFDGATTLMPIASKDAPRAAAAEAVHRAWALSASNVRRAMDVGIWRGWDLHPAQLPARYGAVFARFFAHRQAMTERLRAFVERATRASLVGQEFDDAATGNGLISFFRRGLSAGAFDDADITPTTLTRREVEVGSFADIVAARQS